jgi:hypothetical protein
LFYVASDDIERRATTRNRAVGCRPEVLTPQRSVDLGELFLANESSGYSFQRVHQTRKGDLRGIGHKQVDMVMFEVGLQQLALEVLADGRPGFSKRLKDSLRDDPTAILWHEDQVSIQIEYNMSSLTNVT